MTRSSFGLDAEYMGFPLESQWKMVYNVRDARQGCGGEALVFEDGVTHKFGSFMK